MLYPRYYYREDFKCFEPLLRSKKPALQMFHPGEFLNGFAIGYDTIYYNSARCGKNVCSA